MHVRADIHEQEDMGRTSDAENEAGSETVVDKTMMCWEIQTPWYWRESRR